MYILWNRDVTLASHDSKAVMFIRNVAVCPASAIPNDFVHFCTKRLTTHLLEFTMLCYAATTCISLMVSELFV